MQGHDFETLDLKEVHKMAGTIEAMTKMAKSKVDFDSSEVDEDSDDVIVQC